MAKTTNSGHRSICLFCGPTWMNPLDVYGWHWWRYNVRNWYLPLGLKLLCQTLDIPFACIYYYSRYHTHAGVSHGLLCAIQAWGAWVLSEDLQGLYLCGTGFPLRVVDEGQIPSDTSPARVHETVWPDISIQHREVSWIAHAWCCNTAWLFCVLFNTIGVNPSMVTQEQGTCTQTTEQQAEI